MPTYPSKLTNEDIQDALRFGIEPPWLPDWNEVEEWQ